MDLLNLISFDDPVIWSVVGFVVAGVITVVKVLKRTGKINPTVADSVEQGATEVRELAESKMEAKK